MFNNTYSNLIDAKTLQNFLDEILTLRLQKIGLRKTSNYLWYEQTTKEIRRGLSYCHLKGASGTFICGVNFDFLPTVHSNKLIYHRTAKKYEHHLFERADIYLKFSFGERPQSNNTTHFGVENAKKSITILFDKFEPEMLGWFEETKTLEGCIKILERQILFGDYYDIHFPKQKYVLPFLKARANKIKEAVILFDALELTYFNNDFNLKEKAREKLLLLAEGKNSA